MKICFEGSSPQQIHGLLKDQLNRHKLGSIVDAKLCGNELTILVTKMGTSKLCFQITHEPSDTEAKSQTFITLGHKKIALTHRMLEKELASKLEKIIIHLGGQILSPY